MPDREVRTIRDLLYYQYAKVIARRAFGPKHCNVARNQECRPPRDVQAERQWIGG